MTDHPAILERLAAIDSRITAAHADVAAGATVDLSDLEGEVEAACKIILATPPSDSRDDVEQAIRKMLADLDALARALNQHHQELTGRLIDAAANDAEPSGNGG